MTGALEDRVTLITGAGRGIGRAAAFRLAREGARLVLNDFDAAPLEATLEELRAAGAAAVGCAGSVIDEDFADRFIQTAIDAWGDVHIVVNNAGYVWDGVIQKMTDDQWDAMIDVHLTAPFRILRRVADHVRTRSKTGDTALRSVVNVSSISGVKGNAGQANYASAKAGLLGLTKTLAKEWGRYNVTVNAVAFGPIATRATQAADGSSMTVDGHQVSVGMPQEFWDVAARRTPLGRAGTAEEAAGAIYLLCSPDASFITGQVLICDGGLG